LAGDRPAIDRLAVAAELLGRLRVAVPQTADDDRQPRVAVDEGDQHFIVFVRDEEGAHVAAGERHRHARPDRRVLLADVVVIVEPYLDPPAAGVIFDGDHLGEVRAEAVLIRAIEGALLHGQGFPRYALSASKSVR